MALPFFAFTLFVSAFLLFLVQPIIGKMILPKLGGTPQVWNTCMVFFQTALLAGYGYTHTVSTQLKVRSQLLLHGIVLFIPLAILLPIPFNVANWTPGNLGGNPIMSTLGLLAAIVGLPFLVVATSAPLLQKWFASTGHEAGEDPYFLYAASNLGSMLALLLYPVIVEPFFGLRSQAWIFGVGYMGLIFLVLGCAAMVWTSKLHEPKVVTDVPASEAMPAGAAFSEKEAPPAPVTSDTGTEVRKGAPPVAPKPERHSAPGFVDREKAPVTMWRRLRWVGLAAVPSSFMLGVTTHITTDLSPIPLFWLVPLTLYLLSFILVFARWPVVWVETPHRIVLYAQPAAIALMIFVEILNIATEKIFLAVFFNVLAFFLTALMCHGEMAKDRPSTKHLTEFFLLMSLGGMLGGMFNGLVAPVLFVRVIELNVALILACLLRPTMAEEGWTDGLLHGLTEQPKTPAQPKKGKQAAQVAAQPNEPVSYGILLDFALPVVLAIYTGLMVFSVGNALFRGGRGGLIIAYFIPLAVACFYWARPLRLGLAVLAIIGIHSLHQSRGDQSIYSDRSYFGIISVKESSMSITNSLGEEGNYEFTQLIHGHINHGMNFRLPAEKNWGDPNKDFSRLATTYYHRYGPVGEVMEKYNWFPGPQNTFWADSRMPASLAGLGVGSFGSCILPQAALVGTWSEPPFATIGLGTGTMASYSRYLQHCHFYEIDNHIRRLSLPDPGEIAYFNYVQRAHNYRKAEVQILMGDARLRMALPYRNNYIAVPEGEKPGGGPEGFYHMIVVDAFSSDAIPVHLLTREAFQMYFKHLSEKGILCVHTSNRFVELPKVVAAVSKDLDLAWRRGHDSGKAENAVVTTENVGRYSAEWVMVARKADYLDEGIVRPPLQDADLWNTPTAYPRYIWTDDHSNLLSVLRGF